MKDAYHFRSFYAKTDWQVQKSNNGESQKRQIQLKPDPPKRKHFNDLFNIKNIFIPEQVNAVFTIYHQNIHQTIFCCEIIFLHWLHLHCTKILILSTGIAQKTART